MLTVNGEALSESDHSVIQSAIDGLYRFDLSSRQLCHIASFFGAKKKDSLRNRFDQWHSDGAQAWVFDNAADTLNLDADVIGFDLGHILTDVSCKTPALMYLIYRVEKALLGHKGILFCDEGWKALSDDYFKDVIDDWSRTPRKKNNIFGLATQVANDTANSAISKSINDFGLTGHEHELVKTLPDDQHYFLLNQGRSTNKQSVVIRLNLTGLEDIV